MDLPPRALAHLTTASGAFHAKILEARLGAEGIAVELRGYSQGPYPLPGPVELFVYEEELGAARAILLADEVDAAFLPVEEEPPPARRWFRRSRGAR